MKKGPRGGSRCWGLQSLGGSHKMSLSTSLPAAQLQEWPWSLRIGHLQLPGWGEPQGAWNIIIPTEPSPALSIPEKPMNICPIIGWINKWLSDEITPERICGKAEIESGSVIPHLLFSYSSSISLSSFSLDFALQESSQMSCWSNKRCFCLLEEAKFCSAKSQGEKWI